MKGKRYHRAVAELRIRNMDETLRRELKVRAAREGKTLNAIVIELLAAMMRRKK